MKITIETNAKEMADLILKLSQPNTTDVDNVTHQIAGHLSECLS